MIIRVFLVEDSPAVRENVAAALEELAPVEIVGSADDEPMAASWIRAHPGVCDILVIDIFLRRGSCLDLLKQFRSMQTMSKVVFSNYATPQMRHKCIELGADKVFDKSTEIEGLLTYCTTFGTHR
ncbi:hypothetical protein BH11PSE8_BH11PSE8_24320 [soil metagenome]